MVAFTFRMPSGIPGTINRAQHLTVEPQLVDTTAGHTPQSYGLPMVMDATTSKMRVVLAGDTPATIYGFNVRPYPTAGGSNVNDPLGQSIPAQAGIVNIMRRGYMMVLLGGTTAAKPGTPVFVRVGGAVTGKPLGGLEAVIDPTTPANTIQINATWMGPSDAQGNCEIAFNI